MQFHPSASVPYATWTPTLMPTLPNADAETEVGEEGGTTEAHNDTSGIGGNHTNSSRRVLVGQTGGEGSHTGGRKLVSEAETKAEVPPLVVTYSIDVNLYKEMVRLHAIL